MKELVKKNYTLSKICLIVTSIDLTLLVLLALTIF